MGAQGQASAPAQGTPQQGTAVITIAPPRLPWSPAFEERYGDLGVTKSSWKALTEAVWPSAKTLDGVILALSYCKARNLDPFKKPCHVVPVWSSALNAEVEGVWPGISELRTTAMRTRDYAGCDETEFGPDITRAYEWTDRRNNLHKAEVTFPAWARMTVYRMVHGVRCAFVGPKVIWLETYATASRWVDAPNEMWRKRPYGQIDKCAEAAALRKAFPEELGNEYAAEEMAGRVIGPDGAPERTTVQARTAAPAQRLHADFEDAQDATKEVTEDVQDGEFSDLPPHDPETGEVTEGPAESAGEVKDGAGAEGAEPPPADDFPGDRPENRAPADDDLEAWAKGVSARLPEFKALADLNAFTDSEDSKRRFFLLNKHHPAVAKALVAAINGRRKALTSKEPPPEA